MDVQNIASVEGKYFNSIVYMPKYLKIDKAMLGQIKNNFLKIKMLESF